MIMSDLHTHVFVHDVVGEFLGLARLHDAPLVHDGKAVGGGAGEEHLLRCALLWLHGLFK